MYDDISNSFQSRYKTIILHSHTCVIQKKRKENKSIETMRIKKLYKVSLVQTLDEEKKMIFFSYFICELRRKNKIAQKKM